MQLLAENFRKLEERDKKLGGIRSNWSSSLGDKLKSARRSSKRISNYAMHKFGEGQENLKKKLKRPGKERLGEGLMRDTHSDTEEETLKKSGTPLLFSLSASTQNLSSKLESGQCPADTPTKNLPPPKPPRTFKVKNVHDLSLDDGEELEEDNFSADVFSAIKQVGVVYTRSFNSGIANGCIPCPPSATSTPVVEGGNLIMRSESSPQLSLSAISPSVIGSEDASSNRNSIPETPAARLQTISEDSTDSPHAHAEHPCVDERALSMSPLPHSSPIVTQDDRLVRSAPMRKKLPPILRIATSPTDSSAATLTSAYSSSNGHVPTSLDLSSTTPPKTASTPETTNPMRFSMLSLASAEYYSAESSDASKHNSASPSPELLAKSIGSTDDAAYTNSPFQSGVGGERGVVGPLSYEDVKECERDVRLSSGLSVEDESFNTPPSSPTPPNVNQSIAALCAGHMTSSFATNDRVTTTATLNTGHVMSMDDAARDHEISSSTLEDVDAISADNSEVGHVTNDPRQDDAILVHGNSVDGSVIIRVVETSKPKLQTEDSLDQEMDLLFSEVPETLAETDPVPSKASVRKRSRSLSDSDTPPACGDEEGGGGDGGDKQCPTSKDDKSETKYGVEEAVRSRAATAPAQQKLNMRRKSFANSNFKSADERKGESGRGGDKFFETDCGLEERSQSASDSLVSSFSIKDLEDILGGNASHGFLSQHSGKIVSDGQQKKEENEGGMVEVEVEVTPDVDEGSEGGEEGGDEMFELSLKRLTLIIPDSVAPAVVRGLALLVDMKKFSIYMYTCSLPLPVALSVYLSLSLSL